MKFVVVHPESGEFLSKTSYIVSGVIYREAWTLDIDEAWLFSQEESEQLHINCHVPPEDIRGVGLYLLERDGTPSFLKLPMTICIDDPEKKAKLIEVFEGSSYGFSIQSGVSTSCPSTTFQMKLDGGSFDSWLSMLKSPCDDCQKVQWHADNKTNACSICPEKELYDLAKKILLLKGQSKE